MACRMLTPHQDNSMVRRFFPTLGVLLAFAATLFAERPNIIFVMADDLGYGDAQSLNPKSTIPTPNMSQMAKQGMTFTDAHSPSAVCTPTRYGVVTGRYCWRSRMKSGVLNGYGEPLIDPARETVASFMQKQGYSTGVVGKWHLGLGFVKKKQKGQFDWTQPLTSTPNANGFEYSYVIPASLDFPPYVYIHNERMTQQPTIPQPKSPFPAYLREGERAPDFVMEEVLHHLVRKAGDYIRQNAGGDKPYFLYVPFTAPHKPIIAHPDFRGKNALGEYADFVQQVDWTLGEILKAVDESPGADNTLVIFTSDNGSYMRCESEGDDHVTDPSVQGYLPENHTANGPLRGTKADIWEAGHRVPFFARWPKSIKPASKCDATITHTDLFATCAAVVGVDLPEDCAEDSFSWLPLLEGGRPDTPREPVINHSASGMFAIRDGDWKLVLGSGSGGRAKPKGKAFEEPYPLFNLADDLGETKNVADDHPEIVERLTKKCLSMIEAGRSRPALAVAK